MIVKRGICLYASHKEYDVIIVESDICYGTGDYEDPPETAEDVSAICYYIWFESLTTKGSFNTGGGCFFSIDEAIKHVEALSSVRWV